MPNIIVKYIKDRKSFYYFKEYKNRKHMYVYDTLCTKNIFIVLICQAHNIKQISPCIYSH